MCTQPIVAKKEEEEEEGPADLEGEDEDRGLVEEEERLVELVGRAYPEEIWEELEEVSENSEEENAEDVEAEDEEVVGVKEEEAMPDEVVEDGGLRQRAVGNNGQQATVGNSQATVSCLFDGD